MPCSSNQLSFDIRDLYYHYYRTISSLRNQNWEQINVLVNLLPLDIRGHLGGQKTLPRPPPEHQLIIAQSHYSPQQPLRYGWDLLLPALQSGEKEPYLIPDLFPLERKFSFACLDQEPSKIVKVISDTAA